VRIAVTSPISVSKEIFSCKERGHKGFVAVSATHLFVECQDDLGLRNGINKALAVVPDGRPLYWLLKLKRRGHAKQVRGQTLTLTLLREANESKRAVGIYGGRPEMLAKLVEVIAQRFPNVNLVFAQPGSFEEQSDAEMIQLASEINAVAPDVLFVGLGCPRQEKWMIRQSDRVDPIMVGVGGALDMVAGDIKAAPLWMQKAGLEWFHRLIKEPRRLWRRYLVCNSRFLLYAARSLVLER
jgi:N-acetylglucosaminyldiphosphoundecaprenol N-acetyl-beta-D-mannosaminyltransferase